MVISFGAGRVLARCTETENRPYAKPRAHFAMTALYMLLATPTACTAQTPAQGGKAAADLHFGKAISIAGNAALVGSPYGADGQSAGLAYVFNRTSDGWNQTATLLAIGGKRGNRFGSALAVVDGIALVGASGTDGVAPLSGSAFVFERGRTVWRQVAALVNPEARERHLFGYSVALDANTAVIGAPGVNMKLWSDTSKTIPAWSGAVYIWSKNEFGWRYQGRITPDSLNSTLNSSTQPGPYHLFESFGRAVALHNDILVVSAHNETTAPGKVYVFRRRNNSWKQEVELQQQRESFGIAVAAAARTIAIASSGLVFVYADTGGSWKLDAMIEPRVAGEVSGFQHGGPVSLDGNRMVVGAVRYRKRKGAVHLFERVGSNWNQVATITGDDTSSDSLSGNRVGDLFGGSVSIQGDTILAGASYHDSEGPNFGAAYVFERERSRWIQKYKLVAPPPTQPRGSIKAQ